MLSSLSIEPQPKAIQKDVVLSTVYGSPDISLRKQKAIHALTLTVREQFFVRNPQFNEENIKCAELEDIANTNTTFDIEREEVMHAMGYYDKSKYFSYDQVLSLFKEISDVTLYFDGLNLVKDKPDNDSLKGFAKVLSSATKRGTKFRFEIPSLVVLRIVNPELSYLSPVSWNAYTNKYMPGIFESALYYWQNGHTQTDWIEIEYLRRMTGTLTKTYDDFNKFNKRVVQKTVSTINESPELDLHLNYEYESFGTEKKVGRKKKTHIRFTMSQKVDRLYRTDDVRHAITIAALRTELEALGVARSSLSTIINEECAGPNDTVSIPFLRWVVRHGNELRSLESFKPTSKFLEPEKHAAEVAGEKGRNFGAYLRKAIIRDRKEEWFSIQKTIENYLLQSGRLTGIPNDSDEYFDVIEKARSDIKKQIAVTYLQTLEEHTFSFIKDDFYQFLERQMPTYFARHEAGELDHSLIEMAASGEMCLMVFLDYCHNLFSKEAFQLQVMQHVDGYQMRLIA
jgi:hypothetical protein